MVKFGSENTSGLKVHQQHPRPAGQGAEATVLKRWKFVLKDEVSPQRGNSEKLFSFALLSGC